MRSLNLDHLHTLVHVAELGSFSAAARRLGLSQPAVSLQIRELESRVAIRLLDRMPHGTGATPAGRALIGHAQAIFAAEGRLLAAVRRRKDGRISRVRIGAAPTALAFLLLPLLQKMKSEHPAIDLAVTTGSTAEITAAMALNTIDLALADSPVNEPALEAINVRDVRMVAILPARPRDVPPTVTPADFTFYPMISGEPWSNASAPVRKWLGKAGLDARPALEVDEIGVITRLVALGLGAAIVPEEGVARSVPIEGLVHRPLDPPLALTLALLRRRNRPDDPALAIVAEAILESGRDEQTAAHGPASVPQP